MTPPKEIVDRTTLTQAVMGATTDMFKMFSVCVEGPQTSDGNGINRGFCAVVRFSRDVTGQVAVTLSAPIAQSLAASVYGPEEAASDQRMKEVVAEVANMIAGGIRNNLQAVGMDFDISLPENIPPADNKTASQSGGVSLSFRVNNDGCIVDAHLAPAPAG